MTEVDWEVGTKFTIPHGSEGVFTIMAPLNPEGTRYRLWSQHEGKDLGPLLFTADQITGVFNHGTWVKVPDTSWEEGTRFKIKDDVIGNQVYVVGAIPESYKDRRWVYEAKSDNKELVTYGITAITEHFTNGVWVKVTEETSMTDTATTERTEHMDLRNEIDWLRMELRDVQERAVELSTLIANERGAHEAFRDDMLKSLSGEAENPSCSCEDRYCENFDAFMIRRGYSREEVKAAREAAKPTERHTITITVEGRPGSGGISTLAIGLRDYANELDSDWTGVEYDYAEVYDS